MEASAAQRPIRSAPRIPARLLKLASDDRLVDLVRAGSEPAFEVVYDRHHRGILAFCRHMLGTAEEAEDAVQHTFMAAYRELIASDKRIHLRPWLYTIARNRSLTVLRARRERPLEEAEEPATEHLAAVVQRRQDLRDLLRDLHELPDYQRAALVLAEAGDVSHEEIGEILDVPREKVKALVFQARSSLIASKQARETSCETIREQLVELKGGSLRRNTLRRHLKECTGCTQFRAALQDQRRLLAVALPVVPSVALKQAVLGGTVGTTTAAAGAGAGAVGGGAAGAGLAGGSIMGGGASLTAKVLVVAAVAGGGGATAAGVKSVVADPPARQAPATAPATGGAAGVPDTTASGPQPAGAAAGPAAADPATGGPTPVGGAGAAWQAEQVPATSARPDAAPGKVKEEGASAKPDGPPGQVKDAPVRPETAPGQAKADEKPATEEKPVKEEKPEKVKPESPASPGSTPTTGTPAPGTGTARRPETPPGQAKPTKPAKAPAQAPAKSQRPAPSGGGSADEPLSAPTRSPAPGQGKSTVSGGETTTAPGNAGGNGNAGANGNAGGNGRGRGVGLGPR